MIVQLNENFETQVRSIIFAFYRYFLVYRKWCDFKIHFQVEIVETEPDKVSGDEFEKNSEDDDAATSSENSNVSVSASDKVYKRISGKRNSRSWYL